MEVSVLLTYAKFKEKNVEFFDWGYENLSALIRGVQNTFLCHQTEQVYIILYLFTWLPKQEDELYSDH
jgi:hypothetical protein